MSKWLGRDGWPSDETVINDRDREVTALKAQRDELLAVLQAVVHSVPFHSSHKAVHDRAMAAIAKATGSQA